MSKHNETGKELPDELIDSLIRAKNADAGLFNKRQLFFAFIDQKIHSSEWDADKIQTADLWKSLWFELTGITASPGNGLGSFGHLMGGYDSQYYGYLYSQVYSADLFSAFEGKEFSAALGRKYRDEILAPGGSRDSMESLKLFLGREPNTKAFIKSLGLDND